MSTADKIQIIIELHGALFSLIIGVIMLASKPKIYRGGKVLSYSVFCVMWLLLCDSMAYYSDGKPGIFGKILSHVSIFFIFQMEYVLIILITEYIYQTVRLRNPGYSDLGKKVIYGLMGITSTLLVLSYPFGIYFTFDAENVYHRTPLFSLSMIISGIALVCIGRILWQNLKYLEKNERLEIIMFLICPTIGAVAQLFFYGFSFVIMGITVSVFFIFAAYMIRIQKARKQRDLVLLQSQAYLLNSQIKPHFLFNSLNVIQSLIEEDPETAVKAVNHFSKFLRTGLKMEVMNNMVPLATEMEYVDDYLYLEQLRHGEKIRVVKDIDPSIDFEIPFLTIQPIVENAVRHGICKRIKGGTVAIDIKKEAGYHVIRVVDDGVGYLPVPKEEKEWDPSQVDSHGVGADNVRNRLAMMCNGTFEIDSEPGKGTMVTIRIPR